MIELRVFMRNRGHRRLALALLGLLCVSLLFAHSAVGMGHDSEMDDQATQDAMTVCLAVVQVVGAFAFVLLAATPFPLLARRRRRRQGSASGLSLVAAIRPAASARAGPAVLQVFRL